ncbi:uncharacterized protein LOC114525707 [Dendronephthya gigantea]|nr:uncharacterized protein LOC114525707 [Dendronephthya gigantea]
MSVGHCYLIEALLQFFKMEDIKGLPKENDPFLHHNESDEEKKAHVLEVLDKFVQQFLCPTDVDDSTDSLDDDSTTSDGVFNYALNLLKSFMVLLDCKDAVASGNGEHLATIQKQMLFYFSSVSGYNVYAIEMLIFTIQNEILLSPREAHQCKWAALANWSGGKDKNIEIDLLQENRNADLKGLIRMMGANKTEKAIGRMSKAAGGVRKIVDVFDEQASIRRKSSAHSHRSSSEDENKISSDLHKLKPFAFLGGRSHSSFVGISSDPLEDLNEEAFCEWLKRHQRNIALHFPTVEEAPTVHADAEDDEQSEDFSELMHSLLIDDVTDDI